jgi:Flp pilus assembly protein TadD
VAIDPGYPELHALFAYMHLHRGDHEAALAAMRHAQELEPRSPELTGYLGALLDSIGRQDEAVEAYAAAMRLSAHCPAWIASNLALTCCAVGRLEEAEHTYRALLREHPDYLRALIGLSALYVRQARLREARATARRVLLLDPSFKTQDWRRRQPFSDPATLDAFVADLAAAGLP